MPLNYWAHLKKKKAYGKLKKKKRVGVNGLLFITVLLGECLQIVDYCSLNGVALMVLSLDSILQTAKLIFQSSSLRKAILIKSMVRRSSENERVIAMHVASDKILTLFRVELQTLRHSMKNQFY